MVKPILLRQWFSARKTVAIKVPAVSPLVLGDIHGLIGVPEQDITIFAVIGEDGYANTGANMTDKILDGNWFVEQVNHPLGNQNGPVERNSALQKDDKLVAPKPAN